MARVAILLTACVVALATAAVSGGVPPGNASRTMNDLEPAVLALLKSSGDNAFLIIHISGTQDFVQMSSYEGLAALDFPQITSRQRELRPKVESVCDSLGLVQRIITGSNGAEFLDYDLPKDAGEISSMLRQILVTVFDTPDDIQLEFTVNGFDLPDAQRN